MQADSDLPAGAAQWQSFVGTVGNCVRGNHRRCQERVWTIVTSIPAKLRSLTQAGDTGSPAALPEVRNGMYTYPPALAFYLLGTIVKTGTCDEPARVWRSPAPLPDELRGSSEALFRLLREAERELSDRDRWPTEYRQLQEFRRTIESCMGQPSA